MERLKTAAITNGNDKGKRSFEFRMCKKVAELTQVVHMLFTRNHEKEVEMEALRQAYEMEISEILVDARRRIAELEKQRENILKEQAGDSDRIRKLLEGQMQSQEETWKRKMEENEKLLQEEKAECQKLRDMLLRAQRDIDSLRQGVSQQESAQAEEAAKREEEAERLRQQVKLLETSIQDHARLNQNVLQDLERSRDSLQDQLNQAYVMLDENHATRDQLLARNKQLEADMKSLKRDFHRKVAEAVNSAQSKASKSNGLTRNQSEEIERLRREIQRYRLELSNRDASFNRIFTDKQAVHNNRGGAGALKLQTSHSAGTVHPSSNATNHNAFMMKREKTVSHPPSGPVVCFEEQAPKPIPERQRVMSTPSAHVGTRDNRLPSICSTPDIKPSHLPNPNDSANNSRNTGSSSGNSNSRLSRPRPLPKQLLIGK